jgi:hypothetical protein
MRTATFTLRRSGSFQRRAAAAATTTIGNAGKTPLWRVSIAAEAPTTASARSARFPERLYRDAPANAYTRNGTNQASFQRTMNGPSTAGYSTMRPSRTNRRQPWSSSREASATEWNNMAVWIAKRGPGAPKTRYNACHISVMNGGCQSVTASTPRIC